MTNILAIFTAIIEKTFDVELVPGIRTQGRRMVSTERSTGLRSHTAVFNVIFCYLFLSCSFQLKTGERFWISHSAAGF